MKGIWLLGGLNPNPILIFPLLEWEEGMHNQNNITTEI
jgi:hypothetical protein